MQIAQKLYEGLDINGETIGLITYMRTDGTTLSSDAVDEIRKVILNEYGDKYLPSSARIYKSKAKNAQEAHEAIRPTNINLKPEQLYNKIDQDFHNLYELIWKRTVACQMENAIIDIVVAIINSSDNKYTARAIGSVLVFDGFYRVYREGIDDEKEEENKALPPLQKNEKLISEYIKPLQHFTEPQPKYSESSLVKKLEELGIGRPSTYATILSVLQDRDYVTLTKKRFIPNELGRLVTVFLTGFFKKYVEYDFTASLESELDEIAEGNVRWLDLMQKFWQGFNSNVTEVKDQKITDIISYVQNALDYHLFKDNDSARNCPTCENGKLSLKLGKFGAFLGCSNYPECDFKKSLSNVVEESPDSLPLTENNKIIGQESGVNIFLKKGPYGWYIQLGEQLSKLEKPKRVPLPSSISPNDLTIDIAKKLINLPINLGKHPKTGLEITINIGKFGPYFKYDKKFVTIPKNIDPFQALLSEAVEIIDNDKPKKKNSKT